MKLWMCFSGAPKNKLKNEVRFRLIRYLNKNNHSFIYDIQKKRKILFFEWWETVDTGYKDVHKAQRNVLSLIANGK